jgi:hypothetical protein
LLPHSSCLIDPAGPVSKRLEGGGLGPFTQTSKFCYCTDPLVKPTMFTKRTMSSFKMSSDRSWAPELGFAKAGVLSGFRESEGGGGLDLTTGLIASPLGVILAKCGNTHGRDDNLLVCGPCAPPPQASQCPVIVLGHLSSESRKQMHSLVFANPGAGGGGIRPANGNDCKPVGQPS